MTSFFNPYNPMLWIIAGVSIIIIIFIMIMFKLVIGKKY